MRFKPRLPRKVAAVGDNPTVGMTNPPLVGFVEASLKKSNSDASARKNLVRG